MEVFKKELAELLRKHNVAIVAKSLGDESDLAVEIGFQFNLMNNKWVGRHHLTGYDLDGKNTSKLSQSHRKLQQFKDY